MQSRRSFYLFLLLGTAVLLIFLFTRRTTQADFGPAAALCPGPDWYGYTCEGGAGFAYIDADQDTQLYADDGAVTLELPFPFTFYGTTYTEVTASSNGTLQFGRANPQFANDCLTDGPVLGMGELIAPLWDDLDLQFEGFLETTTVGEAPNRIFVVEWDDVPRFGDNPEDKVTFAVQLFETSHDILFMYEDVAALEGHNGSSATIGLQSEQQGIALQYSCNQPAVADAARVLFPHPAEANDEVAPSDTAYVSETMPVMAKGPVADLMTQLNQRGPTILPQMQSHWRNQSPPRATEWAWVDMTGDGFSELILLWYGGAKRPDLAQLVVLAPDENDQMTVLHDELLSTREESVAAVRIEEIVDLTHDKKPDLLLQDDQGRVWVVTAVNNMIARLSIPERCQGALEVVDVNDNGRLDIVRDGCQTAGRVIVSWNENASAFQPISQLEN